LRCLSNVHAGRATLEGATDDPVGEGQPWGQAKSVLKLDRQSEAERDAIRNAVIEREGLLVSVFDVLRRVPRRVSPAKEIVGVLILTSLTDPHDFQTQ
jgi:hypothetical protein